MSHNICSTTIELTSGKALDVKPAKGDKPEWGSVFALHNRYKGEGQPEETQGYSVTFGANTIGLAKKALATAGSTFVVTGEITGSGINPDKGTATIYLRADRLKPCNPAGKETVASHK